MMILIHTYVRKISPRATKLLLSAVFNTFLFCYIQPSNINFELF